VGEYYRHISELLKQHRAEGEPPQPRPPYDFGRFWRRLSRALGITLASLLLLAAVAFAGDYLLLRYRIATQRNPYGQVTVRPYYAVRLKSGKTEFMFLDPQTDTCVNSLFPHLGMQACWYERRHPERATTI